MFKFKTQNELAEMTEEQVAKYQLELENHRNATMKNEVATSVKAEYETAMQNLKEFLGTEIKNQLSEQTKGNIYDRLDVQLSKALNEKADEIKNLYKNGGKVEITLKAPSLITTANAVNNTAPSITGVQQAPITNINLREIGIIPFTTNLNTSVSAYTYTETKPKDGDYAFLGEGAIKPQIDFTSETSYATPKKVAAWMKLTSESVQDIAGLESIARDFLSKKHNLKKSKGILFGDGLSDNPKGATTYGRLFSAGALALSVSNPNFMDVVNASITDISTTHNYEDETPYIANFVAINPNDFFIHLVSAKDGDGKPLYPTATLFNMVNIGGVTIWADESVPVGKIFVADMSKYYTTNYVPYTVTIGWVNDDFIKNQFVILGESRFHAFVKKLDEQAFIYDNISTIKTAISKP